MTERFVVFSHGKDSEPWGSKIAAMAEIAREEGFHVESVDYRGIDDPQARVTRLLAFCKDLRGSLVLVGSSMGGWLSLLVARHRPERLAGLVLIAAAPDFTERMLLKGLSAEDRIALERDGRLERPSQYSPEPSVFTWKRRNFE